MKLQDPIIVIGTGPVGVHCVQQIHRLNPQQAIILYGLESHLPYNRIKLTSLLSGKEQQPDLETPLDEIDTAVFQLKLACAVVDIDRQNKIITDSHGQQQSYSSLILATGSRPHIPNIPGVDKQGVFTLRDMDHVQALMARQIRSRRTVILGGGLLGLEAARAMQRYNTEVIVIDHLPRLMSRQLDERGSKLLTSMIYNLNIRLILGYGVTHINGDNQVKSISLRNGKEVPCDTVIIATGIQPITELARSAGLAVARGIKINELAQTSDENIYAAGECAEYNKTLYGLVAPGLEQGSVAVHNILGKKAVYKGSTEATRLKVVGKTVFSVGMVDEELLDKNFYQVIRYDHPELNLYRKLVFKRHRLVGAIGVGDWHEISRIQEAVTHQRMLMPWHKKSFEKKGFLWNRQENDDVNKWPASAIICSCKGIRRGEISGVIAQGCQSAEAVSKACGASTVCGNCRPLVERMLGDQGKTSRFPYSKPFTLLSLLIAFATVLFMLMPAIAMQESVQGFNYDELWRNGVLKQISGYSTIALAGLISIISIRKRSKRFRFLSLPVWRLLHISLSVLIVLLLLMHTGLSFGENLNQYLMLSFLAVIGGGVFSGLMHGMANRLSIGQQKWLNKSAGLHLLLAWPLPVLLSLHIFSVYYF